jgi:hypothetical protein
MKHIFKRVVVILNEIEAIDSLLEKAVTFSNQHQTMLEVLFVHEEPLFQLPDYFLSDEKISKDKIDKKRIKKRIQEKLEMLNLHQRSSILVLVDDTLDQVIEYGKENRDILFITAYHEELNSKLLHKTPYSFWIVKNKVKSYSKILLPIDLKSKTVEMIKATQHIFPTAEVRIVHDYRFTVDTSLMEDNHLRIAPIVSNIDMEINKKEKKREKALFESYKSDFNITGDFLEENRGLEEDLVEYIEKSDTQLVVMSPEEIELFLSSNLILKLLHRVPKDFLVLNI